MRSKTTQQEIAGLIATLNAPWWKFWVGTRAKIRAAKALSGIGVDAIPALIDALSTRGAVWAVQALVHIGPALESCVGELIGAFTGEGASYAALALRNLGQPAVIPLINALKDHEWRVRMWSAMTLGKMGSFPLPIVPALRIALDDPNEAVRLAVQEALANIEP
jgi:HEAT repeat protein